MIQKNIFYFLIGFFISIFYYQSIAITKLITGLIIFVSVYSCVYVINDIFDYKRDKKHPIKKYRPIPSNKLKPEHALIFSALIFITGFILSITLINPLFALCIFLMITGNVAYSHPKFKTKKQLFNAAIILGALQYLKLLAGWSITAGDYHHPFLYFLIPACLYLYSTGQLLINSDHYKGRFKITKKEFIVAKTLMIIPAIFITMLLFTNLASYIVFIFIPVYIAFLFIVEKLKLADAINHVNKYMSFLNLLLVGLNLIYFYPLIF